MNSKQLIKKLNSEGWHKVGGKGDHEKFKHDDKPGHVVVQHPPRKFQSGHLEIYIGRQAGSGHHSRNQPAQGSLVMLYPVYVHVGDKDHAHGATVPDFPGCFSGADEWKELPGMVQEAVELYCEGESVEIPSPSSLEDLRQDPEYEDGIWVFIDIDLSKLDTRKERINLSVPVGALKVIDEYAAAHGATRSGFMVKASLAAAKAAR